MGWIKIDRSIQDHWLWKKDKPFDKRSAWIDLLLMANHTDFKTVFHGHVVYRKRGEVNVAVTYLADRWGWSRNKVYRFLELLKEDEMVTVNGTPDGTTVTIENYDKWQVLWATDGTTNESPYGTTGETTVGTHDKNIKNIKKGKENIYSDLPENLQNALRDFEQMRKSIKKPLTDKARKMLLNKLDRLAGDDADLKVKILEQSIFHSWQGVFELKETYENTRVRAESKATTSEDFGDFSDFGKIDF